MSDAVDLTLLSGGLQGLEREPRLPRMQVDQLAGALRVRMSSSEARLGVLEQSVHELATEVARGVGQVRQQPSRHEKRFDPLDAGLASPRAALTGSTERIVQTMGAHR